MPWSRSLAAIAVLASLLAGCTVSSPSPTPMPTGASEPAVSSEPAASSGPASSGPRPPSAETAPSAAPVPPLRPVPPSAPQPASGAGDAGATTEWPTYVSLRYGFRIGHPPGWHVEPSQRTWTVEADGAHWASIAHEAFWPPTRDIRFSAWSVPYRGEASLPGIARWVRDYCDDADSSDCATIGARAVRLCDDRGDCGRGLLVPFATDIQAFFLHGARDERMVVLAAWRPPDWPVDGLGTAREALLALLATMDVRPLG